MKTNRWLAIALVVQLVILAAVYWPRHPEARAGKVLAGLDSAAATGMVIEDGNGKKAELVKKDGRWQVRLADRSLYPAAADKVGRILEKLAGLDTARLVSTSAAARHRLEVADDHFDRRVKISAGGRDYTLYLGSSPGYKRIHVRRGGSDSVYLVRDLAAWELAAMPSSWWKSDCLDYDPAKVAAVTVKNPRGSFRLVRKDGEWRDGKGRVLDKAKTEDLLRDLCRLTITDVVTEKGYAPKGDPAATLAIEGKDGKKELSVWKPEKDGGDYTVKPADADHYVRAAKYALERLLSASPEGLLAREKKKTAKAAGPGGK